MSKKRISPEASTDEQKNEGSDSVFQQDENAKREKLTSLNDTMLHDLPIELLECILVKVVAMEVKDMRLAKTVWKEKADLVISRLRSVCSQWSSILTTNFFRNELHRTLDGTALETIQVKILAQSPLQSQVYDMAAMRDVIFCLCSSEGQGGFTINVYNRNNMAEVEDVIPLPRIHTWRIVACSVSNCLYVMHSKSSTTISILRMTKVDEHQFDILKLISEQFLKNPDLSVSPNGSLILARTGISRLSVIRIYDANGSLQRMISLSPKIACFCSIIPKSNGNLVLVSNGYGFDNTKLTEIDVDGTIIRQSSVCPNLCGSHADIYGRVLLNDLGRFELLDSEFNPLNFTSQQLDGSQLSFPDDLHYNSARNEIVTVVRDQNFPNGLLTVFQFREE